MNKSLLAFLFIVGMFAVMGVKCASTDSAESNTVSQSEIYQHYAINATKDKTDASVTFRFGGSTGTTLILSQPSEVTFNSKNMMQTKGFMLGTFYTLSENSLLPSGYFIFKDTQGKVYTNSINIYPAELSQPSGKTNKSSKLTLPVVQISKEDGLSFNLILDYKDGKKTFEVKDSRGVVGFRSSVYFDNGRTTINLEPDALKDIPAGEVKARVESVKRMKLSQATHLGGEIQSTYSSQEITFMLIN